MTEANSATIERLGLICRPAGLPWSRSHCSTPFVQPLSQSTYRVHFATRDAQNRSSGAWAEFEAKAGGLSFLRFSPKPSIEPGRLGTFDDAGALPSSMIQDGKRLLMYYSGWTLVRTVPFHFFIGLAQSSDNGETFERVSEAPVLDRNRHDPLLTGAPWVLKDGGVFRMWYVSGTAWTPGSAGDPNPVHHYTIKHATSDDGVVWQTNDRLCLPYLENEHAIARPVVMRTDRGYRMIYSARSLGETYRIYSANSTDGLAWQRDSAPMIEVASSGWDSEMVCYGSRLDTAHGNFLLYNGNAYGKDGFGAARVT